MRSNFFFLILPYHLLLLVNYQQCKSINKRSILGVYNDPIVQIDDDLYNEMSDSYYEDVDNRRKQLMDDEYFNPKRILQMRKSLLTEMATERQLHRKRQNRHQVSGNVFFDPKQYYDISSVLNSDGNDFTDDDFHNTRFGRQWAEHHHFDAENLMDGMQLEN
ncbi:hypothetical protein SNEBB_002916 [Seison nebaliae]|nr:hypothetical protein SNEBB_002916 [Seison nebaliae]